MTRPITVNTGAPGVNDTRPVHPVKSRVRYVGAGFSWLAGLVGKVVFWSPVNRLTYVEYPDSRAVFVCSPSADLEPCAKRSSPAPHHDLFGALDVTRTETAIALRDEASRLYDAAANLADDARSAFEAETRADMLHIVADWFENTCSDCNGCGWSNPAQALYKCDRCGGSGAEPHNDLFGPL